MLINGSVDKWDSLTELLLMYAARRVHTERKIKPMLGDEYVVVCDRYFDSSFAYQGFAGGISLAKINLLKNLVLENFQPDLTFILECDVEEALKRSFKTGDINRFEEKNLEFHKKVNEGFKEILKSDPKRCKAINTEKLGVEEVFEEILKNTNDYLEIL